MQTLDAAIATLVRDGLISRDAAMTKATEPERLERLMSHRPPEKEPVGAGCGTDRPVRRGTGSKASSTRKPWE